MTSSKGFVLTIAALCALAVPALGAFADLPAGWIKAGTHPAEYDMGLDQTIRREGGKSSATVKSIVPTTQGFGTLMQMSQVGEYAGKRIRLSGWVKSEKLTDWAGLWLRIDGPNPLAPLGFDNMGGRPIKGTTDWTRYEIVLDVPAQAQRLAFGLLVSGGGQAMDGRLEVRSRPDDGEDDGGGACAARPVESQL
jgi:hypothetical protein